MHTLITCFRITLFFLLFMFLHVRCGIKTSSERESGTKEKGAESVFSRDNLVAWCIVPFDVKERNPAQRAQMLNELGITKLAYDWREKHIPEFDEEIETLKKNKITLQAFWYYSGPNPENDPHLKTIFEVLERQNVRTEIWCMVAGIESIEQMSQDEKIRAHAKPIRYIAEKAAAIGCKVGLYNHGGWYGEPENQLAIMDFLKMDNLGIVYNFHHAKEQTERFHEFFPRIEPHLLSLNLAGLHKAQPGESAKVVPIGQGNTEKKMIQIVKQSGYDGPIGIINEDTAPDARVGLTMNMEGLQKVLAAIGDETALRTYTQPTQQVKK